MSTSIEDHPVRYTLADDVATVTLDRPDRLNAVTPGLYAGVEAGLERATADDARVVVLAGAGRAFCAGADMQEHHARDRTREEREDYVWRAQDACRALQTHDRPVVAAVQGYAIGAGAELALSADFVLATETAEFRFPETTIGTYVGGGLTYTLPARVGAARACELVLRGATVTGSEADEMGLATDAVPADDLEAAAAELAAELATNAPIPMQVAKTQFDPAGGDRNAMLAAEADALLDCMETDDWREGVDAFTEDRTPAFEGR